MSRTSFGNYLRSVRQDHGYTQEQLEERLRSEDVSISQSEISRLERGEDLPTWPQLGVLESVLDGTPRDGDTPATAWDASRAVELVHHDARRAS